MRNFAKSKKHAIDVLGCSGFKPEYFSVRCSADLAEANENDSDLSILTAAWLGNARLIDNVQVSRNAG